MPMVDKAVVRFTGKDSVGAAWLSLVSTQDVVGIKVFSEPGPNSGTRPAVVEGIIAGLLKAGLPAGNIVIWDRNLTDLRFAGYVDLAKRYGVRVQGSVQAGYDEKVFYDNAILGNLVWGDLEFGKREDGVGRKSFVTKLLTRDITKLINVSPLLNHYEAGVCGSLYSLAASSVDNMVRFESRPERLATAIPEIYGLPELADRVVLSIVDALVCQYEGSERSLLHYSVALNELRFSRDPVALDVLSVLELQEQRKRTGAQPVKPSFELYQNAALLELGSAETNRVTIQRM